MRLNALIVTAVLLLSLLTTSAASDVELLERLQALEARVAALEERVSTPPPPIASLQVADFSFARLGVLRAGSNFVEFVGEITATRSFSRVTFRVTFYDDDGAILATDRFSVENISGEPRTFGNLVTGVSIDRVHSYRIEVDRVS